MRSSLFTRVNKSPSISPQEKPRFLMPLLIPFHFPTVSHTSCKSYTKYCPMYYKPSMHTLYRLRFHICGQITKESLRTTSGFTEPWLFSYLVDPDVPLLQVLQNYCCTANPECGSSRLLRNAGTYLPSYIESNSRRP
jgi:hypothetical protein